MKKTIKAIWIFALIALLTACSGAAGGENGPAAQDPATEPPTATQAPETDPSINTGMLENPVIIMPGQDNGGSGAAPEVGEGSADLDAMSLSEVMAAILKDVTDLPNTMEAELDADTFEFTAFVPYSEGMEGLVSEALINAVAHSVVLVRVPEGMDVQEVADTMAANMDPRKWVCVEAEASSVTVRGNTVLLVMSNESAEKQIVEHFNAL